MRKPARFVSVVPSVFFVGAVHVRRARRTVTEDIAIALPLVPEQLRLYVVSCVSGPTAALPDVGWVPLQPPDAVHVVTPALVQESVEDPFRSTLAGDAPSVTAGPAAATVTVADVLAEPPAPVHVSVYVEFAVSAPVVCVPEMVLLPDHGP